MAFHTPAVDTDYLVLIGGGVGGGAARFADFFAPFFTAFLAGAAAFLVLANRRANTNRRTPSSLTHRFGTWRNALP